MKKLIITENQYKKLKGFLINEQTLKKYIEDHGVFQGKDYFITNVGYPMNTPPAMSYFAEMLKKGIDLGLQETLNDYEQNPDSFKSDDE